MGVDKRVFVGEGGSGQNKDVDVRFITNGFYLDGRNMSVGILGSQYVVHNIEGNVLKSFTLGSGSNMCIGAHDDKLNDSLYYFVWNGLGNHKILRYKYSASVDTIEEIAGGEGLNFNFLYLIVSIVVTDNKILGWTDAFNAEVCAIDLTDFASLPSPLTTADRYRIELAKAPEPNALIAEFFSEQTRQSNGLKNNLYKFKTRYVYALNMRSGFSKHTKMPVPDIGSNTEVYTSGGSSYNNANNAIFIRVDAPDLTGVEKIELFVQFGQDDNTMSDWYRFFVFDASYAPQSIVFTGEEALDVTDQTEALQPYSFVPKYVQAIEELPSNVWAFFNFTENINANITPNVSVYPTYNQRVPSASATITGTANNTPVATTGTYRNVNFDILLNSSLNYKRFTIGGTFGAGQKLVINLAITHTGTMPFTSAAITRSVYYVCKKGDTLAIAASKLADAINAVDTRDRGYGGVIAYYPGSGNIIRIIYGTNQLNTPYTPTSAVTITGAGSGSVSYSFPGSTLDVNGAKVSLKRYAQHPFAGQYEDSKGRLSPAIPFGEMYAAGYDTTTNKGEVTATMVVNHIPPADAVRLNVLYAGNQTIGSFFQFYSQAWQVIEVTYDSGTGTLPPLLAGVIGSVTGATGFIIDFKEGGNTDGTLLIAVTSGAFLDTDTLEYNTTAWTADIPTDGITDNNVAIVSLGRTYRANQDAYGIRSDYSFVDGDKVRFLSVVDPSTGTYTYFTDSKSVDINKVDTNFAYINYDISNLSTAVTSSLAVYVEFWRPKQSFGNRLFYQTGLSFPIVGGYHTGNTQNQTASQGAIIELYNVGDVYLRSSPSVTISSTTAKIESASIYETIPVNVSPIGAPAVVDTVSLQEFNSETGVYYTQPYVADTELNGLAVVLGSSFREYDRKYGSIERVRSRDRSLTVWFEDRVGLVGILQELSLQDNGQVTYQTNAILNNMQYYAHDGGISGAFASMVVNGNRNYYLDPKRASVNRLSQDGVTELSRVYKMSSEFFRVLNPIKKNNEIPRIIGAYDDKHDTYNFTIQFYRNSSVTASSSGRLLLQGKGFDTDSDLIVDAVLFNGTNYYNVPVLSTLISGANEIEIYYDNSIVNAATVTEVWIRYAGDTYSFSEGAKGFTNQWDMTPDFMVDAGVDWASFKDGEIWVQNKNGNGEYNYLFGQEVESYVVVPFNGSPSSIKLMENLIQEASELWSTDVLGDIYTPEGQQTYMVDAHWEELLRGQFSAAILKDYNTPNVDSNYSIFEGNDMQSYALLCKFKNSSHNAAKLFAVNLITTEAKLTT